MVVNWNGMHGYPLVTRYLLNALPFITYILCPLLRKMFVTDRKEEKSFYVRFPCTTYKENLHH